MTSSRPLRVLHAVQNLNYGGMEKMMADLVRGLDPRRFECHVLTLVYLGRFSREMEGFAELHVGPRMTRLSLVRPAALAATLCRLAPDIIHTHSGVWYKMARAARIAGVGPLVHTEHGRQAEKPLAQWLDRRAARLTDAVVAVSGPLRDYLTGRLRLPASGIHVIRNGVDTDRFRPGPRDLGLRTELGLSPDQFVVGSIGRLEPVKGYDVVIDAFAALRARCPGREPVLVVAGEGSARPALEARVRQLRLDGRVFLLGWRDDPTALLAAFDCFVLGSWSEGTSVSLLEAMACGVPPVVTAVGGNPDVLGPALASQAVQAGDSAALGAGMARLMDEQERARVAHAARSQVEREFGLDRMVAGYADLYRGLVKRGAADASNLA